MDEVDVLHVRTVAPEQPPQVHLARSKMTLSRHREVISVYPSLLGMVVEWRFR